MKETFYVAYLASAKGFEGRGTDCYHLLNEKHEAVDNASFHTSDTVPVTLPEKMAIRKDSWCDWVTVILPDGSEVEACDSRGFCRILNLRYA